MSISVGAFTVGNERMDITMPIVPSAVTDEESRKDPSSALEDPSLSNKRCIQTREF